MILVRLADRWLRPEIVRFVSGFCLATFLAVTIAMFVSNSRGNTAFDSTKGADYGEFYVVGMILNEGASEHLYDLNFQDERLHQLLPSLATNEHLPFVYPPFLAPLFQPLARLPFALSVAVWIVVMVGMYATSVGLMLRFFGPLERSQRVTIWLLALSFQPFAIECCLGGQISAIGCLAMAVALTLERKGKKVASGLAISMVLYKPTLLLLILPLLVVGRCWKTLGGFWMGAMVLAVVSWLVVGTSGCFDFLGLLVGYGRVGGSVGQGFKTIKYVDLTAFLRLLGVAPATARPMAIVLGLPALIALIISWARRPQNRSRELIWSATLCWTPILNLYAPIYDMVLIVPGLLLAAHAIRQQEFREEWPPTFRWLLALVYLSALVTQPLAIKLGFQPLTLALLAMGAYLLGSSRTTRTPSTAS